MVVHHSCFLSRFFQCGASLPTHIDASIQRLASHADTREDI
jgi:hypothetical protein